MRATWIYHGVPDELRCVDEGGSDARICVDEGGSAARICVRVNAQMGADAILGKAKRKLLARIWARVTGSKSAAVDEADDELPEQAEVIEAEAEVTNETA